MWGNKDVSYPSHNFNMNQSVSDIWRSALKLHYTRPIHLVSVTRGGVEVEEKGTEDSISSLLVLQQQEFAIGLSHLKIKQVMYLLTQLILE